MFEDVKPGTILPAVRDHVARLFADVSREQYLALSGQKEEADLASIYALYPAASDREAERELRRLLEHEADAEEKRRLGYLLASVTLAWLDAAVKDVSDAILNAEAAQRIELPWGARTTFRGGFVQRANEKDRARREAVEAALLRATAELNPRREELHARLHERAAELGGGGYVGHFERVAGIRLAPLAAEFEGFERATADAWREHLEWTCRHELGLPLGRARRHDLAWLLRAHAFDADFPADRLLPWVAGFLERMGLDLRAGGRIRLDTEPRPNKTPRAFCARPHVPDEIYLVMRPSGGPGDYASFLHELGHALHFAHTHAGQPYEYRHLGDNSVTEALALTFDHLLLSEVWLRKVAGLARPRDFLRLGWLRELFSARRYAARLRFELLLHRDRETAGKAAAYADLLTAATGVPCPPEDYLHDLDRHFYSARYLRAWILEAQLSAYLTANFGDDWFLNPAAGRFLKDLWATGQKWTAEEVAALLGRPGLAAATLRDRILSGL